ncbi:MAG: hypothetical protein M1827_000182 [Pycnora praestabilis]|nr:MAG: hypothetical protein M1827_000182 [Pycnora praestabilis]
MPARKEQTISAQSNNKSSMSKISKSAPNTAALSRETVSESESEIHSRSSNSGSTSSSSDSEESEASNGDEEGREASAKISAVRPSRDTTAVSQPRIASPRTGIPYQPPPGFQAISTFSQSSSKASKLLTSSKLDAKQLWYITAPASVPITSIKEVALDSINKGGLTLSHDGADYGFTTSSEGERTRTKLLVPSQSGDGYRLAPINITQRLHLQQMIRVPSLTNGKPSPSADGSQSGVTIKTPAVKPVRPQPQGLKMRFRPFGFGNGTAGKIGSSSSSTDDSGEEANHQPQFHLSKGLDSSGKSEKRKHAEVNGVYGAKSESPGKSQGEDEQRRKRLKHKHKMGNEKLLPASGTLDAERDPGTKSPKDELNRSQQRKLGDGDEAKADETSKRKETSQERASRKEKEKRRKAKDKDSKRKDHKKHREKDGVSDSRAAS